MNGDDWLGGTWYANPNSPPPGPVALPPAKLFGKKNHFTIHWHDKRTVDIAQHGGAFISSSWPVTTEIYWTIHFDRLAEAPQLGGVDL